MPAPPKLDKEVVELIKVYEKAQKKIIDNLANTNMKRYTKKQQELLLININKEIAKLNKEAREWTNETIPTFYREGMDEVEKAATFAKIHREALVVLVRNTKADLIDANQFIGRQIKDVVRQISLDVIEEKIATGRTVKDARNMLAKRLIDEKGTHLLMKNGKKMNMTAYAELVARSSTREATNRGTINQLVESDRDLVKMSNHSSSCPICAPLEGRVYSISGKDKRFPPLDRAYTGTHANIHPNCRHVLTPYIEQYNDVEKDIAFSNRSFKTDPRSKAEQDRYNKEQAKKTKLRNDKAQWERYKLTLPDDTPKTLTGFRRMKRANSERYKQLQKDYRSLRREQPV